MIQGPAPTASQLFLAWLKVGANSFGGGAATLEAMRREFVERKGWVGEEEFARHWSVCQATPGINLIALTVLVGRSVRGLAGVPVSLAGMLLPSVGITVAIAAAFAHFRDLGQAQHAMRGAVPATAGLGLGAAYRIARPLVRNGKTRGRLPFGVALGLVAVGVSTLFWRPVVALLLVGAGLVGAAAWWASEKEAPA